MGLPDVPRNVAESLTARLQERTSEFMQASMDWVAAQAPTIMAGTDDNADAIGPVRRVLDVVESLTSHLLGAGWRSVLPAMPFDRLCTVAAMCTAVRHSGLFALLVESQLPTANHLLLYAAVMVNVQTRNNAGATEWLLAQPHCPFSAEAFRAGAGGGGAAAAAMAAMGPGHA